jgi:hypothetical protein
VTASRRSYLDASAITKLVIDEDETSALRAAIGGRDVVSSALGAAEVRRAAVRSGRPQAPALAERVLQPFAWLEITDEVLEEASKLGPPTLRTLDAIHVASASAMGEQLDELITYDRRMVEAATLAGIVTSSPS